MRIAIIGGGASGMVTAYLLDRQGHQVTVMERQPILGGHIRTLNKNVKPNQSDCHEILESGVLEFPVVFKEFMSLMQDLEVELEPVQIGSAMFFENGSRFLSGVMINNNFTGLARLIEHLRLDTIYARSARVWLRARFANHKDFCDRPLSEYLQRPCTRNTWLKLLVMYSYSMKFEQIDNFPSELAIPILLDDIAVDWVRVKGGVYSYIEKILERFKGEILLNVEIEHISRTVDTVKIKRLPSVCVPPQAETREFDQVVFATPPDQVMALLDDPTAGEIRRFSDWKANYITSLVHQDTSMYNRFNIKEPSEFDFFQTSDSWGYNGYLNQLCNVSSPHKYFLSFQLEELINSDFLVHKQEHHTPMYTTQSFRYRDEVIATNGEQNTYHVGAYLGDGLHGGAVSSAYRVAELIGNRTNLGAIRRSQQVSYL